MQFLLKILKQNPLLNMFIGVMILVAVVYVIFRANGLNNTENVEGSNVITESVQDLSLLKRVSPLNLRDATIEVSTLDKIIITFNSETYDENVYSVYSVLKRYGIAPDDERIVEIVNN